MGVDLETLNGGASRRGAKSVCQEVGRLGLQWQAPGLAPAGRIRTIVPQRDRRLPELPTTWVSHRHLGAIRS
ncbi:hypothetical protein [Streptomyces sp. NPDC047974]|uniref:hypothetical protein n=1 Tax=Streptomyces sp. NPDC047974 TaxID=3154343 RepID=UPI0033E502C1